MVVKAPQPALNKGKGEFPVSLTIILYLKEKFNTLTQLTTAPRWLGPLLTFIAIAINQTLIEFGLFSVQVAWLYVPVALVAMTGLTAGLISAGLVSLYSIWLDPTDTQRTLVVPLSLAALAIAGGLRTRALRAALAQAEAERSWAVGLTKKLEAALEEAKAGSMAVRTLHALNGNIERIKKAKTKLEEVVVLDFVTEGTREKIMAVIHILNNLIFATEGWVQLEEIKARQAQARGQE